jgi:proteasome lid subunit RPN8/RPN11
MQLHVKERSPEEACGLLAGLGDEVQAVYPVTNALHSPVRFRMEPAEQLKAFLEIEERGLELVGIYHSHPNGPDMPSPTDVKEAYYPEVVYVIVIRDGGGWRCRGYHIHEGQFREVSLQVDD